MRPIHALAFAVFLLLVAPAAVGHATPRERTPEHGAQLDEAPDRVFVRFTQNIESSRSTLRVVDAALEPVDLDDLEVGKDRMSIGLPAGLPDGGYLVQWETLSTRDGHFVTGAWSFVIGDARLLKADEGGSPPVPWPAVAGKALAYVGLMVLVGGVAFALFVRQPPPVWRTTVLYGGVVQASGLLLFSGSQAFLAGSTMVEYWISTAFGQGVGARLAVALASALVAAGVAPWRPQLALQSLLALGAVSLYGAFGHTAAFLQPATLGAAVAGVHMAAVGAWAGGLVFLYMALRDPESDVALTSGRFSRLAMVAVPLVVLSGAWMWVTMLGSTPGGWTAALATSYGLALWWKVGLFLLMLALGAWNRWRHVRKSTRTRFSRSVGREVMVALVVLIMAGVVTNQTPPTTDAAANPFADLQDPIFLEFFGEVHGYHLFVDPPPSTTGRSNYTVHIFDPETYANYTDGVRVNLFFQHESDTIPPSGASTEYIGGGLYTTTGAFTPARGAWNLTIEATTQAVYKERTYVGLLVD